MPGAPQIAHFAMWFSHRLGCIEIIIKLGGKTLALLSKRYYLTHKSNGAYSAHTFAKNASVWGIRPLFNRRPRLMSPSAHRQNILLASKVMTTGTFVPSG